LKKAVKNSCSFEAGGAETAMAKINKVFLLLFVHKKKRFPLIEIAPGPR
jgi:hypothetical protein